MDDGDLDQPDEEQACKRADKREQVALPGTRQPPRLPTHLETRFPCLLRKIAATARAASSPSATVVGSSPRCCRKPPLARPGQVAPYHIGQVLQLRFKRCIGRCLGRRLSRRLVCRVLFQLLLVGVLVLAPAAPHRARALVKRARLLRARRRLLEACDQGCLLGAVVVRHAARRQLGLQGLDREHREARAKVRGGR